MGKFRKPIVWSLFTASEVFAALAFFNLYSCDFKIWTAEGVNKTDYSRHIWLMGLTMIILNGHGMVIFRLFPKQKTVIIKYLHMLIHIAAIIGFVYAYIVIRVFMTNNEHPPFTFNNLHTCMAVLTLFSYMLQLLVGIVVYLIIRCQRTRKEFGTQHNFMGICVLQLAIATACCQLQRMSYEIDTGEYHAEYAIMYLVLYGMMVNSIVLNPYLNWRLVGPI